MSDCFIGFLQCLYEIKAKKIIIFGAGEGGLKTFEILQNLNTEAAYFIDNDINKQNKEFCGLGVFSHTKLLKENKEKIAILVSSMYGDQIAEQLKEMSFIENVHFFDMYSQPTENKGSGNKLNYDIEMRQLFEKVCYENLNLYNAPLQTRRWLKLLREDSISGYRIAPDLHLDKDYLGFSFCSNQMGLRGPSDVNGDGVIFGTSFAMGFGVDNGLNWYDTVKFDKGWLNLGLPVGPNQINNLYRNYYRGSHRTALLMYFCNFWTSYKVYNGWEKSNTGIFEYMHWKTGFVDCLEMAFNNYNLFCSNCEKGIFRFVEYNNDTYFIDTKYGNFEYETNTDDMNTILSIWRSILSRFENVIVVRIPNKEYIAAKTISDEHLLGLANEYDKGWSYAKNGLKDIRNIEFYEPGIFTLDDYLPFDPHWSSKGNLKFSRYIVDIMNNIKLG